MKQAAFKLLTIFLLLELVCNAVECKSSSSEEEASEDGDDGDFLDGFEPVEIKTKQIISLNANPRGNGKSPIKVVSFSTSGFIMPGNDAFSMKKMSGAEPQYPNRNNFDSTSLQNGINDNPPPWYEVAKMARYIVQYTNWSSLATISSRQPTTGFPFVNIISMSDGPLDKSTGVPYFYITPLDMSVQDLQRDPRASLTVTLAQSNYCTNNILDPEDPRCAHVILSGNVVRLVNGSEEEDFARRAMFTKHPAMKTWPADHGFFFAKLDIKYICVLDFFGGAKNVDLKEYYKARVF